MQQVHGTINQGEKRIGKIHTSDERKQASNRKLEEKRDGPPRIIPKTWKEKEEKDEEEEEKEKRK